MCHRFNVKLNLRLIAELFEDIQIRFEEIPGTDRYPMSDVATIRRDGETDQWIAELRQWGWLPSHWKPSENYKTRKKYQRERFNARSETADSTWGFRRAFASQRCVVIGTSFYEPYIGGGEARYTVQDELFFFAGLWDRWEGEEESVDSCTMLTTEANPLVAANRTGRPRQPVILTEIDQVVGYCNPEVTERTPLNDLLQPLSEDVMAIHPPE